MDSHFFLACVVGVIGLGALIAVGWLAVSATAGHETARKVLAGGAGFCVLMFGTVMVAVVSLVMGAAWYVQRAMGKPGASQEEEDQEAWGETLPEEEAERSLYPAAAE